MTTEIRYISNRKYAEMICDPKYLRGGRVYEPILTENDPEYSFRIYFKAEPWVEYRILKYAR